MVFKIISNYKGTLNEFEDKLNSLIEKQKVIDYLN
jgi:hypothetical protein